MGHHIDCSLLDNDDLMKRLNQWAANHKNSNLWSPLNRESKNLIITILYFIKCSHFKWWYLVSASFISPWNAVWMLLFSGTLPLKIIVDKCIWCFISVIMHHHWNEMWFLIQGFTQEFSYKLYKTCISCITHLRGTCVNFLYFSHLF